MTIKKIKEEMLAHRDFWGGDIMFTDKIEQATTKIQLREIMDEYESHLQMMAIDAISHHGRFKRKLGLHLIF